LEEGGPLSVRHLRRFRNIITQINEDDGGEYSGDSRPSSDELHGFLVKTAGNVPVELMEEFDVPTRPVIFRGSEESDKVARSFVLAIDEVANKIYRLLKTNVDIVMSEEQRRIHEAKLVCDLCESNFTVDNRKVADHDHLSGKFRHCVIRVT